MAAETGVTLVPVTGDGTPGTVFPYAVVSPYSKLTVVEAPLALTVPFSVAEVGVILVAASGHNIRRIICDIDPHMIDGRILGGIDEGASPHRLTPPVTRQCGERSAVSCCAGNTALPDVNDQALCWIIGKGRVKS